MQKKHIVHCAIIAIAIAAALLALHLGASFMGIASAHLSGAGM